MYQAENYRLAEARRHLELGLKIAREIGYRIGEGRCLNNLGNLLLTMEEYDRAIAFFQESLSIAREMGSKSAESITLNNSGLVYAEKCEYDQALQDFQLSLDIAQKIGDRDGEGVTLSNIAKCYERLGHSHNSSLAREQAAAIFEEVRIPPRAGSRQWLD